MTYLAAAILTTGLATYLLRVTPLVLLRREIDSRWVRSFLHYTPFAVLTAMTLPAIFSATSSPISAAGALLVAVTLALRGNALLTVALGAAIAVYLLELALSYA